ncbi:PDDEXK nuclease domain-containing protein [Owenweeksia hongkongensis]|uniref:PDDEXK nuclease domain-containing protein n=1 Tax=Owenweeksia hongkongensis TaxID=253245 RepID=UPI003A9458D4
MPYSIDLHFIKSLKEQILQSRYQAARLVNRELVLLYFNVGQSLHQKIKEEKWGAKVLETLSAQLQQELPGLRGFSAVNLRRMKLFYEAWHTDAICSTLSSKLEKREKKSTVSSKMTADFLSLSFSHHYEIALHVEKPEHRWYYIEKIAKEFWSVRQLRTELKNKSHLRQNALTQNFDHSLPANLSSKALLSFKDEYLLDFINLEDPDEETDERVLEHAIVQNIKKFLMSLGSEFSFMGNQYRLQVEGEDYFIDLLFYHRGLQALVAFELKKGKFKPEYAGKMNFYLSALDDLVKLEHENPAVGIILCKEKNTKTVEYSFRDVSKPMGVSVFKTAKRLPEAYKKALPTPETLKRLMD